jgi:dipeptidyl aminopeptidase/acylaminoacyl peptidase
LERSENATTVSPLLETYSGIAAEHIHPTRVVTNTARAGLAIPALLTMPRSAGGMANRSLPFVVLPHDGPSGYGRKGFNYRVQFLASRGYGILQPQFRGSSGHGAAFEKTGHQQWGLLMQDDLTDGTPR